MSSSPRVQKLREQRARANAAKAAASSSSSVNSAAKSPLPTPASSSVPSHASSPSWVKPKQTIAPSATASKVKSDVYSFDCRIDTMSTANIDAPTIKRSDTPDRKSPACSNEEWFQYTNGSTTSKLRTSRSRPLSRAQQPKSEDSNVDSNDDQKQLDNGAMNPSLEDNSFQSAKAKFESTPRSSLNISGKLSVASVPPTASKSKSTNTAQYEVQLKPPRTDSDGFSSAKSRFETNSIYSGSTNDSVLSGMKKTYHSTPICDKRHLQPNPQNSPRKNEVPWPSETTNSLKRAVTPSPVSKVTSNQFISTDRKQNSVQDAKRCGKPVALDRFLSMHETKKSAPASVQTNNSSETCRDSSPSSLKRNKSTPSKAVVQSNSFVTPTPVKRSYSSINQGANHRKNLTPSTANRMTPKPPMATIRFTGSGSPVWIHASLLKDSGHAHTGWDWVRAFMQDGSSKDSVTVIIADSGRECTVEKRDDLILMGNSWWSGNEYESDTRQAPSPTSVTQFDSMPDCSNCAVPPSDLVELAHLHEAAIVHALSARYEQDQIYTYTGSILLALNPFKKLHHLYTREMMELYWTNNSTIKGCEAMEKPPPHAYAVAERAFSSMLRSLEDRDHWKTTADLPPCDQSILVSGESGAGKTVTTKIILRYLTILSQRRNKSDAGVSEGNNQGLSVENQVLQSNPVLESFGNARTIRNDNSSRFGKYIEMSFSSSHRDRGALLGASIHFYLLEKVRLVSVNPGERNYHVFYEVLSSGMSTKEKKRYMLTNNFGRGSHPATVKDFYMTSLSGTFDRSRDGVDDADTYKELRIAMNAVGLNEQEQDSIFCVVAALLHASNLRFVPKSTTTEDCKVYEKDGALAAVASLLGLTEDAMRLSLTSSVIEARGERLIKRLSMEQAEKALEAVIKATYAGLFALLVQRINESIEVHKDGRDPGHLVSFAAIGVLDIFGFESFESNSFEQLCINYCNEALQQQFNRFVFKAEQAEYQYEGIKWSNIEFTDNQEALDLIEDRRSGIFSVLDEQCKLPRCNDNTFARAIFAKCEGNAYFEASQMQQSKRTFVIAHFAGRVEYETEGFLLKNKDELPKSACELLAASNVPLISALSSIVRAPEVSSVGPPGSLTRSSSSVPQSSVSSQFVSQLKDLRSRITQTGPHYIRCLKPNDSLVPDHFEESLIAHQLNCAGVLPAMKLARAGYSMRYSHSSFILRFRCIASKELPPEPKTRFGRPKLTSEKLLNVLSKKLELQIKTRGESTLNGIPDIVSWSVQIGKTKVFLREVAFNALEELRLSTINVAAARLQSRTRVFLCRSRFLLILGSVITLQCATRKLLARLRVFRLRCTSRAVVIQKNWRSYSAWVYFQNSLFVAITCQRFWRGGKVRESFSSIKEYRAAISLQSFWRSYIQSVVHRQVRDAAIIVQCAFRVYVAKRTARQLRREANDVSLIIRERDQLRLEMKQMRVELEGIRRNGSSICPSHETMSRTSGMDPSVYSQSHEIRMIHQECAKKDRELRELRKQVDSLCGNKSTPSTLPTTVTISRIESPSFSSLRYTHIHSSSNLLDSEMADLDDLECSAISTNEESLDNIQLPSLHLSSDSHPVESGMHEFPLHYAVEHNNKTMFLLELERSCDVDVEINSTDSVGRTPLHIAVQCANMDFIQLILSHNVVVNNTDFSGNTALHLADSVDVAEILLNNGLNPNIPNCDGLCALHLAVKKQEFSLVRALLSHGADVTSADDLCWHTPLHLVAHGEEPKKKPKLSVRGPIAELLCEAKHPALPDLNYQDREGNTPLHWAASLAEEDAGILISIFLEHGACPKIANNRGQTPIHLYCHNVSLRQNVFYHEALQLMLAKGDPNQHSSSGCTPLHLALYHQDFDSARLLVRFGAEVNVRWRMPLSWDAFWTDMESEVVLPLDMVEDLNALHSIISDISSEQYPAPHRSKCMHCKMKFRILTRKCNCSHCGRSICGRCSASLQSSFIPRNGIKETGKYTAVKVCILCEAIMLSNGVSSAPSSILNDGNQSELSIGTISM